MKKSASEQLLKFGESIRESINCAKTGTVEKVSGKFADIKLKSGQVLAEVPVFKFGTGTDRGLKFPLKKGDTGLLLFFDHNIDAFQNSAEKDNEVHNHDISDCLFIPGFLPDKERNDNQDNVILENKNSKLVMEENKLSLGNNSVELVTSLISTLENLSGTLTELITGLVSGTVSVAGTPVAIVWGYANFVTALGEIKVDVETLKSDLTGLKI